MPDARLRRARFVPLGYQFGEAKQPPGAHRLFCAGCNAIVVCQYEIMLDATFCPRRHLVERPLGAFE